MKERPISARAKPANAAWALRIFGAVFTVAGGATAYTITKPFCERWFRGEHVPAVAYFALLPLLFVFAGVRLIVSSFRPTPPQRGPQPVDVLPDGSGTAELKSESSGLAMFIAMTVFALFWNGFIAFAVYGAWSQSHSFSMVLLPFMAVGLALVAIAVYSLLKLFNPRPSFRLTPGAIPLGGGADLEYTVTGAVERIRVFRIWLEAVEEAKYQQGTDTITKRSTFERIPLLATENPTEMRAGTIRVQIPEFTMHSFEASHNKIIWFVKVAGDVPRWPDVDAAYPIRIVPLPTTQG